MTLMPLMYLKTRTLPILSDNSPHLPAMKILIAPAIIIVDEEMLETIVCTATES